MQCGKLALLDRLLTRLHSGGHKVLIFSQVHSLPSTFSHAKLCAQADNTFCEVV